MKKSRTEVLGKCWFGLVWFGLEKKNVLHLGISGCSMQAISTQKAVGDGATTSFRLFNNGDDDDCEEGDDDNEDE